MPNLVTFVQGVVVVVVVVAIVVATKMMVFEAVKISGGVHSGRLSLKHGMEMGYQTLHVQPNTWNHTNVVWSDWSLEVVYGLHDCLLNLDVCFPMRVIQQAVHYALVIAAVERLPQVDSSYACVTTWQFQCLWMHLCFLMNLIH